MAHQDSPTTGSLKIKDACPGLDYFYSQNSTGDTILHVNVSNCVYNMPDYPSGQGVVYGMCYDASTTFCKMHVQVPRGSLVRARVERLAYWCEPDYWRVFMGSRGTYGFRCSYHTLTEMFVVSPQSYMYIMSTNNPPVKVEIDTIKRHGIMVQYLSEMSGYVMLSNSLRLFDLDMRENITAPSGHAIMLSVQQSHSMVHLCSGGQQMKLMYSKPYSTHQSVAHVCVNRSTSAKVIPTTHLQIQIRYSKNRHSGIKTYFSALPVNRTPEQLASGEFNCSVSHYYTDFGQHLDCNVKTECEDGRDEAEHCPYSRPHCPGLVASRNKCFMLIIYGMPLTIAVFDYHCKTRRGRLASLKTREEQEDALPIFQNYYLFNVVLGFKSGWESVPFQYSKFRVWFDDTVIYNLNHFAAYREYVRSRVAKSMVFRSMVLSIAVKIETIFSRTAVCEIPSSHATAFLSKNIDTCLDPSTSFFRSTRQVLAVYPDNRVTHVFLLYDPNSLFSTFQNVSVGPVLFGKIPPTYAMFRCDDDVTSVPYTLVCDFRQDCPDTSDESFCQRPSCPSFLCSNSQCVLHSQRCNEFSDCLDDSDELSCPEVDDFEPCAYCHPVQETGKKRNFYNNLDGTGFFTQQAMTDEQSCPDTHYRCPSEWLYCLPVYTRCNGFSDCIHGEDEQECETVTCPNFYKCRDSAVYVHGDHLCDGWAQCPQQDDEMTCDMTCPEGCLCQGHSFLCVNPFPADRFPQLRYLDATGSKMPLDVFSRHTYLVGLCLSHCSLVNVSHVNLTNLQVIDLANNHFTTLDLAVFLEMPNLRSLQLTNNPLFQLTKKFTKHIHYELRQMDISITSLKVLDKMLSVYLPLVEYLNVSFSALETIESTGLKHVPRLAELDTRGNPLENFPLDLFLGSDRLKNIFSSNYRLCCELLLPNRSGKVRCLVPDTVLPSCRTLIPTELYRVFFWGVGVSATLGNVACIFVAIVYKQVFRNKFLRAVAHLQLANVCMGVHVCIILGADELLHGPYILFEKTWTNSVACKVAWFLSFLSSEVSVFIIWFITLHHVIVLCFPQGSWRFNTVSTTVACAVTWFVGTLLSLIPFLPGLSHWRLYGQSGLCRLASFHQYKTEQEVLWFTAFVIVNVLLCVMSVAGQVAIHRKTPKYRIVLDPAKRPMYSSIHLMGKMAVADTVCWFSFSLVLMMVSNGVPFSDQIHGTLVIFVLPINSALNPFLYLWTAATQQQRQAREEKLMEVVKSRLSCKGKKSSQNK